MLSKTITYTNFDDVEVTETFYFNLTKAELLDLFLLRNGNYSEYIQQAVNTKNGPQLIDIFKTIIRAAYGEKTEDGHFVKDPVHAESFIHSEAYSALLMEFMDDEEKSAAFISALIPRDIAQKVDESPLKLV
jgi:hypothetical protein